MILSTGTILANDAAVPLEFQPIPTIGPQATTVKGPKGEQAVEVVGTKAGSTSELIVCNEPGVTSHDYVVRGRVKYDGVVGDGYLELWNDFGDQGIYFSRGLAEWGPMKKLTGTSDWREFELPFHANPGMKPRRLFLNIVLPGEGKVVVSQPLVVASVSSSGQWWTNQQSGWVGGIIGTVFGILGGLIGLSCALIKSRTFTLILCLMGIAISGISLVAGIVAISVGQPYHVYYPLLMLGLVGVFVLGFNVRNISRRFQDEELRRMQAVDAS